MKLRYKNLLASVFAASLLVGSVTADAAGLSRAPQDNFFFASANDPLGLDPALVDDEEGAKILSNLYEGLLAFKPNNTDVVPCLATSWDVSEDGKVYTFHLRQGVKFHDGTPFNAEAVKFNFDRQMPENRTPKMSYAGFVFADVVKTDVVDEYTVKVTLSKNATPFLHNLAMSFAGPIVSPKALKENNNNVSLAPCGTGPYKFVAWDRKQQVVLTRNDEYWGEKAKIANLIFRVIPEPSARVVALNNGELDAIVGIDANIIPEITKAGNKIFQADGMNINYVAYNVGHKGADITKDKDVRRAISQAVNVPELVESLYKGYSTPAHTFLPSFMSGYDKDLKQVAYDPEAAKKTLAEKGIKKLDILTYSGARFYNSVGGQVLAEAIQSYLNKVGVECNILVYDWTAFKAELVKGEWDLATIGWTGDNGDTDNFLSLLATDDPIANNGVWRNAEYDKLIAEGLVTPDGEKRSEIYKKAEKIMADEVAILPISHAQVVAAYNPRVKNFSVHQTGVLFLKDVEKDAK